MDDVVAGYFASEQELGDVFGVLLVGSIHNEVESAVSLDVVRCKGLLGVFVELLNVCTGRIFTTQVCWCVSRLYEVACQLCEPEEWKGGKRKGELRCL